MADLVKAVALSAVRVRGVLRRPGKPFEIDRRAFDSVPGKLALADTDASEPDAARTEAIAAVVAELGDDGFTKSGFPKIDAVKAATGFDDLKPVELKPFKRESA